MLKQTVLVSAIATGSLLMAACGNDSRSGAAPSVAASIESTPRAIQMNYLGRFETGQFGVSAAEVPAFDAASRRGFVVNAREGALDVLDLSNPASPTLITTILASSVPGLPTGVVVNSVAVQNGLVAIAIESTPKTNTGFVAVYRAANLALLDFIEVGAQPDMLVFTPDNKTLLVANEGEPSDTYQVDPEGSVSVIDVTNPTQLRGRTAGFRAFNSQLTTLRSQGVRIYGPNATVAQDLEPEYIAVSPDSKTAYVALQENNALAVVDVDTARILRIMPLGFKDHGIAGNGFDASDRDNRVNLQTWPGVVGMYQPDAIAVRRFNDIDYVITANEGDAREWNTGGNGLAEEIAISDLFNRNGFQTGSTTAGLRALAGGALLNPTTFSYCGATAGNAGTMTASVNGSCIDAAQLGRLRVTWTEGFQRNPDGTPKLFDRFGNPAAANTPAAETRLMYDNLFAFGARSMAVFDGRNGDRVWDSGDFLEQFTSGTTCRHGVMRDQACAPFFNSNHAEPNLEGRSRSKGPEPEGLVLGGMGTKIFAFLGFERVGGVMAFDVTDPRSPIFQDYLNSRNFSLAGLAGGDLGAEASVFVPSSQSPTGKPLVITGHEVSGTTSVYEVVEK